MKKENAKFFKEYLQAAYETFYKVLNEQVEVCTKVNDRKVDFSDLEFESVYHRFMEELKENILEYRDVNFIDDYLIDTCGELQELNGFDEKTNREIISGEYEMKYLKSLKGRIEKYHNCFNKLFYGQIGDTISAELRRLYNETIDAENPAIASGSTVVSPEPVATPSSVQTPEKDARFDFSLLKAECEAKTTIVEKVKLITDRMFDFEQWQLEDDPEVYNKDIGPYHFYSSLYYPNFIELCSIELRRLEKQLEIEKRMLVQPTASVMYKAAEKPFRWNATDTDFLELFAALHHNESIARKDGSSFTRKEMLEYFQDVLGLEIKDVDGKLNKAGNRNANTPFLDTLAQQFRNYVAGKEKRAARRR